MLIQLVGSNYVLEQILTDAQVRYLQGAAILYRLFNLS